MLGRSSTVAAFILLAPSVAFAQATTPLGVSVDLRDEIRDSYIFVFNEGVAPARVPGAAQALTQSQGGRVTRTYTTALKGFSAKMPAEAAARLAEQNPQIAYYEADGVVFAFPRPPWASGGDKEADTSACEPEVEPWGVSHVGGPSTGASGTAWVIDSGVDLDHPDLNVDVGRSANFVTRGKDSPNDGNGHGTHVAGTIAAIDNDCDVVGVAAGVPVVAVRVLDNSGSGSYSGVIAGVDYVAANATVGDVANMSLGGPRHQVLNAAVEGAAELGIRFAIAAGNETAPAADYSPASAEHANVYTVAAINSTGELAWFSNYGNPPVDCAAPGVGILSTKKGGGTTTFSGTSMAAPHVAGLLSLYGPPYGICAD